MAVTTSANYAAWVKLGKRNINGEEHLLQDSFHHIVTGGTPAAALAAAVAEAEAWVTAELAKPDGEAGKVVEPAAHAFNVSYTIDVV